ncbi:MAG: hypothetical protein IPK22_00080 [Verrucomicrobiaceae bacterium]|nr:hypothetical protein [Verrucomicrobiaceae bacterium]
MNREEAKLELDATTLRPQDASPEARAMLESDAELAVWHAQRTAFDEKVAVVLAASIPAGLRESLLQQHARPKVRWITPTILSAAAACIAGAWLLLWPGNNAMAAWESQSLAAVAKVEYGMTPLDAEAETYEAVKALLNQKDCPCPSAVPATLASLRTYGCKRIEIDGRPASIICFQLQTGKEAHLVVLDNVGLDCCPEQGSPSFKTSKNWSYASWSHGSQSFMLATTDNAAELKKLFGLV